MGAPEVFLRVLDEQPSWTVSRCLQHPLVRATREALDEWRKNQTFLAAYEEVAQRRQAAVRGIRRRIKQPAPPPTAPEAEVRKVLAAFGAAPQRGLEAACREYGVGYKSVMASIAVEPEKFQHLYDEALSAVIEPIERAHQLDLLGLAGAKLRERFLGRHRGEIYGPGDQVSKTQQGGTTVNVTLIQQIQARLPRPRYDEEGILYADISREELRKHHQLKGSTA